jgi:hypothetical protein
MNWKWATALVAACMGVLLVLGAESADGATGKPYPPGYRCAPVWLKCYRPGTVPPRIVITVPAPVRTGGTR